MKSLILILSLLLCSCTRVDQGTVVNKWYEPERTYTYWQPLIIGKLIMSVPRERFDDADFCVELETVDGSGDTVSSVWYLTPAEFSKVKVGQFFCVTDSCRNED